MLFACFESWWVRAKRSMVGRFRFEVQKLVGLEDIDFVCQRYGRSAQADLQVETNLVVSYNQFRRNLCTDPSILVGQSE